MKIWVIVSIVSLIATLVMGAVFVVAALVALNGFTSMSAAMPNYLLCNCAVWPLMVGVGTLISRGLFALAKQKPLFWQIGLLNAIIVTIFLGVVAIVFYFL